VVLVAVITGVLAAATWAVLQQLKLGAVWKAVGAGTAAALPTIVAEVRARIDRREQYDRRLAGLLRLWTPAGGPRVRDVADMVALGVTPAAALTHAAESATLAGTATPYVRRTVDDELDIALGQSQFVVLVGDSKAGKSRTAFEAMHRHFPDRLLLVPASKQALAGLAALGVALPAVVLWLDELDTYLGADGLTVQVLEQLYAAGQVMLLGTMRAAQYARYGAEQEVTLLERKVLERATMVNLPRRLDAEEQARAVEQAGDPRIAAALVQLHRYGLAEYVAAGPALLDRWRTGQSVEVEPVGAAIVAAAIDWRRAGRSTPVPGSVLKELYPVYLEDRAPTRLTAEAFTKGLGWATQRVFATAALLAEGPTGLVAFDYLVDYVQRQEPTRAVPDRMWKGTLAEATDPNETYRVAAAAFSAKRQDIAEQALRLVVATDTRVATFAASDLGAVLFLQGQVEEAETWLRTGADAGDIRAASNLGTVLSMEGREEEAETWLRTAADDSHTGAAFNLGNLLYNQRRLEEAETWWRTAADAGDTRAAAALVHLRRVNQEISDSRDDPNTE
jgi:predicted negative regulator of RcsB-dependent stress response